MRKQPYNIRNQGKLTVKAQKSIIHIWVALSFIITLIVTANNGIQKVKDFLNSEETIYLYAKEDLVSAENATIEEVETPTPTPSVEASSSLTEEWKLTDNNLHKADVLVAKYIDKYVHHKDEDVEHSQKSLIRARLHCLLHKESKHTLDKGRGDKGMAGGPLQFWEDTYNGYRRIMIEEGYVSEVGSRYDLENAIETTVWAVSNGREKAWGPILRNECL